MIVRDDAKTHVYTLRCSLCGRPKGDGWWIFADHIAAEHTPEDAGLSPVGERQQSEPVPV